MITRPAHFARGTRRAQRLALLAILPVVALSLNGCAVIAVTSAAVSVASTAVGAGVAVGSAAVGAVGSVGKGAYNMVRSAPPPAQ